MAGFVVERLSTSDVAAMRGMLAMFGDAFDDPESYQARQPDDAYLARILGSESFIAIAAFANREVVGGIVAYVLDKFEQQRREIYLYDLAVASVHRRRGIATALIEHLKSITVEAGAYVIFVQADLGDEPAIALYEKMGVREDVLHFDIVPRPAKS